MLAQTALRSLMTCQCLVAVEIWLALSLICKMSSIHFPNGRSRMASTFRRLKLYVCISVNVVEFALKLADSQIPVVPTFKFLGVHFDRRFSFIPHIEYVTARCQKALNLLRVVAARDWGAYCGVATTTSYNSACKFYSVRILGVIAKKQHL